MLYIKKINEALLTQFLPHVSTIPQNNKYICNPYKYSTTITRLNLKTPIYYSTYMATQTH